ncbi:unnamed protein product [Caenorhabditis angaria]|uniref:Cation efflux protein transmembrane domain-containing protein n=1 Tax=Caenorhabditis angaria TaxID=860376 RepID=A0A9P1IH78_9PELO|nr:unnamed protein product [Caenorhabditis angaria]
MLHNVKIMKNIKDRAKTVGKPENKQAKIQKFEKRKAFAPRPNTQIRCAFILGNVSTYFYFCSFPKLSLFNRFYHIPDFYILGMIGFKWVSAALSHPQGSRGLISSAICLGCVGILAYCVSTSHSIVLMSTLWITIFAFCSQFASLYSMSITNKPTQKYSYGLARVPVLAVFSTTVLAQLFSIFLSKESFEHILAPDHHGTHDANQAAHEHEAEEIGGWPYFVGSAASSIALLLSAYALKNSPFQHVLTSATASSLQEHASDLSTAICWVIPGLSRLLLPRINSMVLLAGTTSTLLILCEHFKHDFTWADPVCCLILSIAVFSTMWPLSTYTGMILLQTTPPHLINQIDRCISEASTIDGVLELKGGRFWQLDFNQLVGSVDVRVRRDADEQNVLAHVTEKFSSVITVLSVQVVKDAAWSAGGESNNYPTHISAASSHEHSSHGHSHDEGHGHSHNAHDDHGHSHSHHDIAPQHQHQSQLQTSSSQNHRHSHDSGNQHGHSHDGVTYH